MPNSASGDSLIHDDDFADGDTWTEDNSETKGAQKPAASARYAPKWRNIEQYWEERRLREQLKDDLLDEE